MAVTAAEPSGLWGSMKEAFASSAVLAKSRQDPGATELVKTVIAEFESPEGRAKLQEALKQRLQGANAAEILKRSLENLREVSAILDAKAPGDAAAYKAWLQGISQKVAEAAKGGRHARLRRRAGERRREACARGHRQGARHGVHA